MTRLLRTAALLLAIAAVVDPVFAVRRSAPVPVDVVVPAEGEPGHADAVQVKADVIAALSDSVRVGTGEVPRAVIAVGDAKIGAVGEATVFAVSRSSGPQVVPVSSPSAQVLWGQQPLVSPSFRGRRMTGQTTTFRLIVPGGATLGTVPHAWKTDDEAFAPRFSYAPSTPGHTVLRVVAESDTAPRSLVDVAVTAADRKARVFVFEPRPTWTTGFARQALESDPLFDVRAVARTSRGIVTQTPGAPATLAAFDPESVDVVLVGGLDALTDADVEALVAFAARRGGCVLLAPDARLPEKVRRAFELPNMDDTLLERPVDLQQSGITLRASEVLQLRTPTGPASTAIVASPLGKGQVMLSTGLDAWRYRGDPSRGFERFWRAVVADAALAAVPPVSVHVDPLVARPGEDVTVRVNLRALARAADEVTLPKASSSIVAADGAATPLRLWPGTRATEYLATFAAPPEGRYDIRIDVDGLPRQDAMLIVDAQAARPVTDRSRELEFLASATGGATVAADDLGPLVASVRGLAGAQESRQVRPTRSTWWLLAFVACVSGEWTLRRSRGLR